MERLVSPAGFEPAASSSRTTRAGPLRYSEMTCHIQVVKERREISSRKNKKPGHLSVQSRALKTKSPERSRGPGFGRVSKLFGLAASLVRTRTVLAAESANSRKVRRVQFRSYFHCCLKVRGRAF